jgi:hypothetical protein
VKSDGQLLQEIVERIPVNTTPWTDIDATTAEQRAGIRKPINIQRANLGATRFLQSGDELQLVATWQDGAVDKPPAFQIDRQIAVDSVTKFEVIDEFGLDVGIGFVLGQAKR